MAAMDRLGRHYALLADVSKRAVAISSSQAGAYPTEYLPGLLTDRIAKGRVAGSFFDRIPITDARVRTFPRVTQSTTVYKQTTEGVNVPLSDFATEAVSATPDMYAGQVDVSRQVIDGGDPDAERMILADLQESYMQVSEVAILAAIEAGAQTGATPISAVTPHAGIVANIVQYQAARFLPAQGVLAPAAMYEGLLLEADTAGRPLVPFGGPNVSQGEVQAGAAGASVLGIPILMSWGSAAIAALIARKEDAHYYESSVATFRYEQVAGPAVIRIGLWAYLSAVVRRRVGVIKAAVSPTTLAAGAQAGRKS